jgi:hypothetical protein
MCNRTRPLLGQLSNVSSFVPFCRENPVNNNAVNVGISKNLEFRKHQPSDRLTNLPRMTCKAAIIWVSTTPELKSTQQSLLEEA